MSSPEIRKLVTHVEETWPPGTSTDASEGPSTGSRPRRAWAAAVVALASGQSEIVDFEPLLALGERLGNLLGRQSATS